MTHQDFTNVNQPHLIVYTQSLVQAPRAPQMNSVQYSKNLQKEAAALRKNPTEDGLSQFLANTKPNENDRGNLNARQLHAQHQAATQALRGSNHQSQLWSKYSNKKASITVPHTLRCSP